MDKIDPKKREDLIANQKKVKGSFLNLRKLKISKKENSSKKLARSSSEANSSIVKKDIKNTKPKKSTSLRMKDEEVKKEVKERWGENKKSTSTKDLLELVMKASPRRRPSLGVALSEDKGDVGVRENGIETARPRFGHSRTDSSEKNFSASEKNFSAQKKEVKIEAAIDISHLEEEISKLKSGCTDYKSKEALENILSALQNLHKKEPQLFIENSVKIFFIVFYFYILKEIVQLTFSFLFFWIGKLFGGV